jgi:dTDP-4-amino-4,6-dideoxygalactose transaminase
VSTPLALDGGTPVRTTPYPRWPSFGPEELAASARVIESGRINYWTGTEGRLLETEAAASLGRKHAVALMNGSVALELALRAFGIGAGDDVVVPARTFIATASSVVAVGATPVIADIDLLSGNMTAETLAAAWTPRTKAVIPVHLAGWPVDMAPIAAFAHERGAIVIEDCAQAHGAAVNGSPCGNLGSDAAAFSYCQDKIVPAGEGGLLVLDDDAAYTRAWEYKDHGKSLAKLGDASFMNGEGSFKYIADSFGTNWRMHEIAAAITRVGLAKLPAYHAARTANALALAAAIADVPGITVPLPAPGFEHAFYRLGALVDTDALASGWTRDRIISAVTAEGVPMQFGSCAEIYREGAFVAAGLGPASPLSAAHEATTRTIAFHVHPTIGPADIADTAAAVAKVMAVAVR